MREYVFAGKRDQLWNVIPDSIQTPKEIQASAERLQRYLNRTQNFANRVVDMNLTHLAGDKVQPTYRRGEALGAKEGIGRPFVELLYQPAGRRDRLRRPRDTTGDRR